MKVELIKQIFNNNRGYKIKSIDWCCDKLKNNPVIDLYDEYCEDNDDVPEVMIRQTETITSFEDEWEQNTYYPIKVCPFCGKSIEIFLIKQEDVSEQYNNLKKQRDELWEKCRKTDSKKKEQELRKQIQEIDEKIEWFYYLHNYKRSEK